VATKDFNTATLTAKLLYSGRINTITLAGDSIYAVPSSRCAKLQTLTLCNTNSSATTVDVYVVPSGFDYTTTASVTFKASSTTTRTLTIPFHTFLAGQTVLVAISDANYNGTYTITSVTTGAGATIVYTASTSVTQSSTASTGTAAYGPGNQHKIVDTFTIGANDSITLEGYVEGLMLGEGDGIRIKPSVTNVVNAILTGVEGT
jgi:hypothetical protein